VSSQAQAKFRKTRTNVRTGLECANSSLECFFFAAFMFLSVSDNMILSADVATSAVGVEVGEDCAGGGDQGPGLEPQVGGDLNDAHQARCLPCSLM
jgi:hypothetical protein